MAVNPENSLITLVEQSRYDINGDGSFDRRDRDVMEEAMSAALIEKDANDIREVSATGYVWQFNGDDTISNQGFADIHNVKASYMSDQETTPLSSPQGTVRGENVNFLAVARLAPKQVITYSIVVKGVKVGDSRNKVILTCDELQTPVEETESTTVY